MPDQKLYNTGSGLAAVVNPGDIVVDPDELAALRKAARAADRIMKRMQAAINELDINNPPSDEVLAADPYVRGYWDATVYIHNTLMGHKHPTRPKR